MTQSDPCLRALGRSTDRLDNDPERPFLWLLASAEAAMSEEERLTSDHKPDDDRLYARCMHCGLLFLSEGRAHLLKNPFPEDFYGPQIGWETCPHCKRTTFFPGFTVVDGEVVEVPTDTSQAANSEYYVEETQYRFVCALQFDRSFQSIKTSEFPEQLQPVCDSFKENMSAVVSCVAFPSALVNLSSLREAELREAVFAATGQVTEIQPESLAIRFSIQQECIRIAARRRESVAFKPLGVPAEYRGIGRLDFLLAAERGLHLGIRSQLSAMIVLAWTAFETLSADAWEACINERPRLAFKAYGADPSPNEHADDVQRRKNVLFKIPQWLLDSADFNLLNKMGTVLRAGKKWDIARRSDAADAYRKVFGKDTREIDAIFSDERLKWTAAVRNVIVHKAGVTDREFKNLVSNHPSLARVKEGEKVTLDGTIVAGLLDAVSFRGVDLLRFVGDWMQNNPS